jgi:dUTP pyrophosphatase
MNNIEATVYTPLPWGDTHIVPHHMLETPTITLTGNMTITENPKIGFEKVSFEKYLDKRKDYVSKEECAYEYVNLKLPSRATKGSAGYDFVSPFSFTLKPKETRKIPLGIKSFMQDDMVLDIVIRSSLGFKYDVVLTNAVGIIDSDYYNNENNEGHIMVKLINHGKEDLVINAGDYICQGIFRDYYTTCNDTPRSEIRTGGIGSTDTNKE